MRRIGATLAFLLSGCADPPAVEPTLRAPPPPPASAPLGDGAGRVYVVTTLDFGDASPAAWADLGYDLDGLVTTDDFSKVCAPSRNASGKQVFPDGFDGIDNSYGRTLRPIMHVLFSDFDPQTIDPSLSELATTSIGAGRSTLAFSLANLGDGASYSSVDAFAAGARDRAEGAWRFAEDAITDPAGDPAVVWRSARVRFERSYVSDDTWVGIGSAEPLVFTVFLEDYPVEIRVHHPIVSMHLSRDHTEAVSGIIAGILDADEISGEARALLRASTQDLCAGQALESIVRMFDQAADIPVDGGQAPGTTCDGISIGLGFTAEVATVMGTAPPSVLMNDCDDP